MGEQQKEKRTVEWSFSFEKLSDQISEFVRSATDGEGAEVKTGHFSTPLEAAASAQVRVDFSVGESTIRALPAESSNLLDADLTYVGEVELTSTGEAEKVVRLSQKAGASDWVRGASTWFNKRQPLRWDVALTRNIPLDLDLHCGAGRVDLDLSALQLTGFSIGNGAGEVIINLPAGEYAAKVGGGVGRTSISIPNDAFVDLKLSSGAGEVNLDIGQHASVQAQINGGVGEFNLNIPEGAAVRLEARTGIGSINVGGLLQRISASNGEFWDKGGVWETANFEDAERQIVIHFNGGIGAFNLR